MNRILLIEDEASTQLLLKNRLEDLGHEVVVASTGARGLMEARAARFDMFLVDVGLGSGIDGYEVCRRLKATPQVHSVPVLLISGRVRGQEELHRGYEAGCDSFLLRGDVTLVEDVVRAMLRIKSLQDDLGMQNRLLEEQNRRLQEERQRGEDLEMALQERGGRTLASRELAARHPDAVLIVDGDGIVRFADRGASDVLGKGLEGKNLGSIAPSSGLEAFVRDARTYPSEGYRFDLGASSMTASVIPFVPRRGTGERPFKAVLIVDAGRRRVASEMLRLEELAIPRRELGPLLEAAHRTFHPSALPGDGAAAHALRARIAQLATVEAPALIAGAAGTKKDWVARSLHFAGARGGPFVPVECASLAPDSLATELFGRASEAGSGGDRPGALQRAAHGTVYLPDVEWVPPELQARIVEVLSTGEVRGEGAENGEPFRARLVASTTVDLAGLVERKAFDGELFRRLSAAAIRTTRLAERREDIPLLAAHYLRRYAPDRPALALSREVLWLLGRYDWPRNDRELEACIETACADAKGDRIEVGNLAPSLVDHHKDLLATAEEAADLWDGGEDGDGEDVGRLLPAQRSGAHEPEELSFKAYERLALERALRETGGDKREAARLLKIGKSTFYRKLSQHGIK